MVIAGNSHCLSPGEALKVTSLSPRLGPKNFIDVQISEPNVQTSRIYNAFFKILLLPSGTAREWVENG